MARHGTGARRSRIYPSTASHISATPPYDIPTKSPQHIFPYLPISPHISPYLSISPRLLVWSPRRCRPLYHADGKPLRCHIQRRPGAACVALLGPLHGGRCLLHIGLPQGGACHRTSSLPTLTPIHPVLGFEFRVALSTPLSTAALIGTHLFLILIRSSAGARCVAWNAAG